MKAQGRRHAMIECRPVIRAAMYRAFLDVPAESLPSAARIVEREEARRRMIEVVLELSEPLQTAILLRYYEDLPPRAIAQRLDLPLGTIKTRLKRGLQQLRQSLDRKHGGDRNEWCLGLAPLAGIVPAAAMKGMRSRGWKSLKLG